MILDFQNDTRIEEDPETIANLVRKGWVGRPAEPSFDPSKESSPQWDGDKWVVDNLTSEQLACIQGEVIRQSMLQDFGNEPPGVQAFFSGLAETLKRLLQAGQIGMAKLTLETAPQIPGTEELRAKLLAHFP